VGGLLSEKQDLAGAQKSAERKEADVFINESGISERPMRLPHLPLFIGWPQMRPRLRTAPIAVTAASDPRICSSTFAPKQARPGHAVLHRVCYRRDWHDVIAAAGQIGPLRASPVNVSE